MRSTKPDQELNEQVVFDILSHSIRRTILREIYQNSFLSYTDLQQVLGHGPGVIYHHLQKLQEIGILHQRPNKEYELTIKGTSLVSYMDHAGVDATSSRTSQTNLQLIFQKIPLAKLVLESPKRLALELIFLLIVLLPVQTEMSLLVIGPFLIPSKLSFLIRLLVQIIVFIGMVVILEILSYRREGVNRLPFLISLLILPVLSAAFIGIFWLSTLVMSKISLWLFWIQTAFLQAIYIFILIHLLMDIKNIPFERSVILALIVSYSFLFLAYFIG